MIIKEAILNNISNGDRSKNKYDFLVYLYKENPKLLKEIFNDREKVDKHIQKLYTLLRGTVMEKKIASLYFVFIKEFTIGNEEALIQIVKRFPSIGKFFIKEQ
ncbi:MAG: hypothetical protein U9O24_08190 [Campylobacterota bacterium]|nr:hypothetical protein [Campylobacterota bacterium]